MRILGIDPGYAIMGWGIVEKKGNQFFPIDYGAITTPAEMNMTNRLKSIYEQLTEIIIHYTPKAASVEELFFNTNTKTAIMVGQARGVALLACANKNLSIGEYTPLQIKQALTGYGRADKKQVQMMVKTLLHLSRIPKVDDTADALAAAICHGHALDSKVSCLETLARGEISP